jgi:uncharacterized small protein (DUF1192 family)
MSDEPKPATPEEIEMARKHAIEARGESLTPCVAVQARPSPEPYNTGYNLLGLVLAYDEQKARADEATIAKNALRNGCANMEKRIAALEKENAGYRQELHRDMTERIPLADQNQRQGERIAELEKELLEARAVLGLLRHHRLNSWDEPVPSDLLSREHEVLRDD